MLYLAKVKLYRALGEKFRETRDSKKKDGREVVAKRQISQPIFSDILTY